MAAGLATKKKSRSLFHYTSAHGLVGIVRDGSLFATHAEFSNDTSECKLILPHLKAVLVEDYKRLIPELIKSRIMNEAILREHGEGVYEEEAESSVRVMLQAVNNTAPYFITSFCIHDQEDYEYSNGLLSQWRGYARGGFALEFDESEVDALNAEEHAKWRYQGLITDAVAYEKHEERVRPEKFKGMAGAFLRSILPELKNPSLDAILGNAQVNDFAHSFLSVAPFLKHYGFREEAEYRVVALCNRPTRVDPGDKRQVKEIHFRTDARSGNVVPYIALYEGLRTPLPIKSVVIGPHAQQKNQLAAVELLFEKYRIDAKIRLSSSPFRD
jgi:hypothetical protein